MHYCVRRNVVHSTPKCDLAFVLAVNLTWHVNVCFLMCVFQLQPRLLWFRSNAGALRVSRSSSPLMGRMCSPLSDLHWHYVHCLKQGFPFCFLKPYRRYVIGHVQYSCKEAFMIRNFPSNIHSPGFFNRCHLHTSRPKAGKRRLKVFRGDTSNINVSFIAFSVSLCSFSDALCSKEGIRRQPWWAKVFLIFKHPILLHVCLVFLSVCPCPSSHPIMVSPAADERVPTGKPVPTPRSFPPRQSSATRSKSDGKTRL